MINRNKDVCIVGCGHIGLPLALHISLKSSGVNIFDKDKKKLNDIKKNKINFFEKDLLDFLELENKKKKLNFFFDYKDIKSKNYIICIGSILEKNKSINNTVLIKSLINISKILKSGDLVIIRGTVQVGFTSKVAKKIIEKTSRLKVGKNIFLGFMPERLIEGDSLNELNKLPQIISGVTYNCVSKVKKFADIYFDRVIEAKSTEEAEIIKLSSNSFRDLNFAFSNEISRICEYYDLSSNELIEKANFGYSRNYISLPSLGVGGFCLPKDPYIFSKLLNKKLGYRLSDISRKINDETINRAVKKINFFKKKISQKNKKLKILILGVAFKGLPETIDLRNSPSLEIYYKLKKNNNVKLFDVNGKLINKYFKIKDLIFKPNVNNFNLVLIINNHPSYQKFFRKNIRYNKSKNKKILFDPWNIVEKKLCSSLNWSHVKI